MATNKVKKIKKHPGGRPTVMTKETIAKLEAAFAYRATDQEACFYANIDMATLYRYEKDHPEFSERKLALKESPILAIRKCVIEEAKANADLGLKFLERVKNNEFGLRREITGIGGGPITMESYENKLKRMREEDAKQKAKKN
jgi:hypothetical protein